jgi:hypothetical protein
MIILLGSHFIMEQVAAGTDMIALLPQTLSEFSLKYRKLQGVREARPGDALPGR